MAKRPRRIHINKSDLVIVVTLIVLVSGLTFALGMLLGYGVGGRHALEAAHSTKAHRDVASVAEEPAGEGELEIVQAYSESKQQLLNELLHQQARQPEPKSIADAKAYFDALGDSEEKGSEAQVPADRAPAQQASNPDQDARRLPAAVKGLFEPSANEVREFVPTTDEWTIQIASYPTFEQAQARMLVLKQNNVQDAYVQKITTEGGSVWHSLFVGSYKQQDWTNRVAARLKKRGLIQEFKVQKVP